jgi:hypothetical protein
MATNAQLNTVQLESTIAKLNIKLARQLNASKDTEAHISALRHLIDTTKAAK